MSESLLKKDFKKSDVQRFRNLVNGEYGAATKTQIGYETSSEVEHKEGDIWESGGKTWTIEDGLKVSVSKLQKARSYIKMPLTCPNCGKAMNTRLDEKMYPIHGMCFDCVTKFEDDLKRAGLYKEYEKQMMSKNIGKFVEDLKARIQAMREDTEVKITTDEGTVENWGKASTQVIEGLEQWANLLTESIN